MSRKWKRQVKKNKFHARQLQENALCEVCLLQRKALQWHHCNTQTKVKDISSLVNKHTTFEKLKKEIAKCDLVCNDCHQSVHRWWAAFDTLQEHSIKGNLRILYYAISRYREWKS